MDVESFAMGMKVGAKSGGGSSGGGVLVAHAILVEDENNAKKGDAKSVPSENYRLDKTAGEIITAIQSNLVIVLYPETISLERDASGLVATLQGWYFNEDGGLDGSFSFGYNDYYYLALTDYPQTNN